MIKLALIGGVLGFISISVLEGLEGVIVAGFVLITTAVAISILVSDHVSSAREQARRNHMTESDAYTVRYSDNEG
ncbi:MAG: hypothetical protein KKE76_05220 [Gammaproteobacteria bacterium]|nr:hypothetical protein [Gammaproteobacteria bacterium]